MAEHTRAWDVLLLGGPSGTGKSAVSYPLARHYGVAITEVDDFTTVLEQMTMPDQQTVLHYWRTHPEAVAWPAEDILQQHLAVAEALRPALEGVIARHLENRTPMVLEGDYLLPSLAARTHYAGVPSEGRVQAVFLIEADERQLVRNFSGREPEEGEQDKRAQVSRLYGEWLTEEAEWYGLPALSARPWETLMERIIAAVESSAKSVVQ